MRKLVLLAPLLALMACTNPPQAQGVFADVPLPDGFRLEESKGHVTPTGHIRVYTQILAGIRRHEDVARFYRDVLPAHGWTLTIDERTPCPASLTFEKKAERCVVGIAKAGDGLKVTVKLDAK